MPLSTSACMALSFVRRAFEVLTITILSLQLVTGVANANDLGDSGLTTNASALPAFSVEPRSVTEDVGTATIVVRLSSPLDRDVQVSVATSRDTAINGEDFYGVYRVLRFSPGDTTKTIGITILDDDIVEDRESLRVRLFNNTPRVTAIERGLINVSIEDDDTGPSDIWRPTPGTSWQWQLTGTIDTSFNVQMYDIDLFDAPQTTIDTLHAAGRKVVCYFSAGSFEDWRPDADAFPAHVKGRSNGWPGEKWLDIRALDALAPILQARLDLAAAKKCDGVEPDNIDGYTNNSGFPLTANDQLRFNIWLAQEAHDRGLSIGLKNDLDQVRELEPHFDWALNEQCYYYRECDRLSPFVAAGKAVFGVEYEGNPSDFCPRLNALNFDWLKKRLDLSSWRESCR